MTKKNYFYLTAQLRATHLWNKWGASWRPHSCCPSKSRRPSWRRSAQLTQRCPAHSPAIAGKAVPLPCRNAGPPETTSSRERHHTDRSRRGSQSPRPCWRQRCSPLGRVWRPGRRAALCSSSELLSSSSSPQCKEGALGWCMSHLERIVQKYYSKAITFFFFIP